MNTLTQSSTGDSGNHDDNGAGVPVKVLPVCAPPIVCPTQDQTSKHVPPRAPTRQAVCSNQIQLILDGGHEILIVSKPHLDCVAAICKRFKGYKKKILFRFTIGSAANETLKFWEPNAPSLDERLQALKLAHQQGFQTSISCEPMLDDNIEAVVKLVEPYVTTDIWIGKMNHVRARLSHNKATAEVVAAGEALIKMQCDENIKSLYARLKNHPKIMWKDTIKKVVGIEAPQASDLASRWTMRTTE